MPKININGQEMDITQESADKLKAIFLGNCTNLTIFPKKNGLDKQWEEGQKVLEAEENLRLNCPQMIEFINSLTIWENPN